MWKAIWARFVSPVGHVEWLAAGGLILIGSGCSSPPLLAVANANNNTVTEYALPANGDIAPTGILSGARTGLALPAELAHSGLGLYVGNNLGSGSITAYFPAATGDASPLATIAGPHTGLTNVTAIALDSPGNVYALTSNSSPQILVYPRGSTGDQPPMATIAGSNTGLDAPIALAVSGAGQIYVANYGQSYLPSVTVYAPGSHGNVAPYFSMYVGPYAPVGIAVDSVGAIYLTTLSPPSVIVYPSASESYPSRMISGSSTGLNDHIGAIAVDSSGNIYASGLVPPGHYQILVFGPKANGNVKPDAIISGAQTKLDSPQGLTVLQ